MNRADGRARKRWISGASAVGVAATTAGLLLGSAPAAWAAEVNPFDDAGGFSVYVRDDAALNNSEIEGALAVGGELTIRVSGGGYAILHQLAGTGAYTPPTVDGDITRLLIGSFSASSGLLQVKGGGSGDDPATGYAKIVDPAAPFGFAERGGYTQYRDLTDSNSASNGPAIDAKNQPWDAAHPGRTFATVRRSVAAYVEDGPGFSRMTACLADLASPASTQTHHVSVRDDGGKAELTLVAGMTNVVDYSDLLIGWQGAMASQVTYAAATPAADTALVVRVPAGTTRILGSTFGTSGQHASYVMWDLSALSGAVTITDNQGGSGRIDGSIYAPDVDLTATFGPLDGQLISRSLVASNGSGELHAYFFAGSLPCGQTTPTSPSATGSTATGSTPTAPSTSESTTSAPTPSVESTTSAPTPSVQPSTSAPTSVAPSASAPSSTAVVGDGSESGSGTDGGDSTGSGGASLAFTGTGPVIATTALLGFAAVVVGAALILARRS